MRPAIAERPAPRRRPNPDDFIYVPSAELSEALALGARRLAGDARLIMPRPLPDGVSAKSFDRWRTQEARYSWCMRYIARILNEGIAIPDIEEMMETLGKGAASYERVYLYVPTFDTQEVRLVPGVQWDRRRRVYYATPEADMSRLYRWLTPAAKTIWEAEQVYARALTLLVQDRAREAAKPSETSGGIETERPSGMRDEETAAPRPSSLLDLAESQEILRKPGRSSYSGA